MYDKEKNSASQKRRKDIVEALKYYQWYKTKAKEDSSFAYELQTVTENLHKLGIDDVDSFIDKYGAEKLAGLNHESIMTDEPRFFKCNVCKCEMQSGTGSVRYHCTECHDFDLCPACHDAGKHSEHLCVPETEAYGVLVSRISSETTLAGMLIASFKAFSSRLCLGERKRLPDGTFEPKYTWVTYDDIRRRVFNLLSGLSGMMKITQHTAVSICGKNTISWFVADWACAIGGFVSVPLHHAFDKKYAVHAINSANVSVVICEQQVTEHFLELIKDHEICPSLKWIVQMEPLSKGESVENLVDMQTLEAFGADHVIPMEELPVIDQNDLHTIVFTSGSTGTPKGVPFNEKLYTSEVAAFSSLEDPIVYSLAHISDRQSVCGVVCTGGRIGMVSKIENVFEDIMILSPSHVSFTPRMYNILYSEFERLWQSRRAEYLESCSGDFDPVKLDTIREECKAQIKHWLGTRVAAVIVGGAALNPKVKEFLIEVWGENAVYEGYGTTESSHIADSTGRIYPDVQWFIEDVPEMGYHRTDLPFPRGELMVKTSKTISSYIGGAEDTVSSFTKDGFFRTGDIVELVGRDRLRVIDRRKAIFKLAQGEFVSPARVEEALSTSQLCKAVYVTFSSLAACEDNRVVAVVVPDERSLRDHLSENPKIAKEIPFEALCETPEACACVLSDIHVVGSQQGLRPFEIPVAVSLDPVPWSIDNGMLTASLKINRPNVQRAYAPRVKALAIQLQELPQQNAFEARRSDVIKTVSSVLGISESDVGNDIADTFVRHGGDSLSAIRLVTELKQNCNIDVRVTQLLTSKTSTSIDARPQQQQFSMTGSYQPSITLASTASSTEEDQSSLARLVETFRNDALLDYDESKWTYRCDTEKAADGDVFLTGCTGFLGMHILDEFLRANKRNERRVFCLIHAENEDAGRAKLLKRAEELMISVFAPVGWVKDEESLWKRVIVVCGDLEQPGLGIKEDARREVVMNAVVFIHVGARVNHVFPYEMLRSANVLGTLAVLELARQSNAHVFCHVSTLSVLQGEQVYSFEQLTSTIGYVQSKAVAEHIVFNTSQKHHLPVVMMRPAMLSWSSRTGAYNREDWLMRFILGCISIGCAPRTDNLMLYLVPVNFMAGILIGLLSSDENYNKSYNIDNVSNPVEASAIFSSLSSCAECLLSSSGGKTELEALLLALGRRVHYSIWKDVVRREQSRQLTPATTTRRKYIEGLSMFLNSLPSDTFITSMVYYPKDRPYPRIDSFYLATLCDAILATFK